MLGLNSRNALLGGAIVFGALGIISIPLANSAASPSQVALEPVTTIVYQGVSNPFAVDNVAVATPVPKAKAFPNDPKVPGISGSTASTFVAGPHGQSTGLSLLSVLIQPNGSEAQISVGGKPQTVTVGSMVLGHKVIAVELDRVILKGGITITPSVAAYTLSTETTTLNPVAQPVPGLQQGPLAPARVGGSMGSRFSNPANIPGYTGGGFVQPGAGPPVPAIQSLPQQPPGGGAVAPYVPDAGAAAPFPANTSAAANALGNFVKALSSPDPQST